MKIVILGLSITSAWGNGHATTFRALCRALHGRGHEILFFERNVEWYQNNRDLPHPEFCNVCVFEQWDEVEQKVRSELSDADVAVLGSYFPDGVIAAELIASSNAQVKAFYDIDTPITISMLRSRGATDYLRSDQVAYFDVYFSFTGGPMLKEIEDSFGSPMALPLYCSFDPTEYFRRPCNRELASDLSYMGTYAADRQPKVKQFLVDVAERAPGKTFIVAGPQYPSSLQWPENVRRITHLNPQWHAEFYSSSRFTLNVTRREMILAGYSPSVRLFEAAACGACIVSDDWPGLNEFFEPGREILLPTNTEDVLRWIHELGDAEVERIGMSTQARVLAEHTSESRAREVEHAVERARALRSSAQRA